MAKEKLEQVKEEVVETVEVKDVDPVLEAKKLIEEAETKKMNACLEEVLAVLEKHGYTFKIDNTLSLTKKNNG